MVKLEFFRWNLVLMKIEIKNLIPHPLVEIPHADSEVWEVDSVGLTSGELYSVEAGSGKGKTSLLGTIYGVRTDYNGHILMDGRDVREFSEIQWAAIRKTSISCIFQGLELFDGLTAFDNIRLKNRLSGYKSEAEIENMAQRLGIFPFLERKVGILSFGQRQRVAIIRALCQKMDFLLGDEIFSHLDRENRQLSYDLIKEELTEQKAGLVLTSLDGLPSLQFDRILVL
jgi:putative ABC transport system ATP-binding protein